MKFSIVGHRSDADTAWERLGDTDFMNRVAGNGRVVRHTVIADDTGYPVAHGALEGPLGQALPFEETDINWVHHRYFRQERVYDHALVARSCYVARLETDGDGVVPHIEMELDARNRLLGPVLGQNLKRMQARWQAVLDALPEPGVPATGDQPRTLSSAALEFMQRWESDCPDVAGRMTEMLRFGRDTELQKLRPFSLADRWSMDREQVLVAMLRGVNAGALELYWSVQCPRCYGQVESSKSMTDLVDHAECSSCRIGFGADLGEHVEAVFAPHPGVMPRVEETFCTLFPAGAPRLHSVWILDPAEQRTDSVQLYPGRWRIGHGGDAPDTEVDVVLDGGEDTLRWQHGEGGAVRIKAGEVGVALANGDGGRARVQLARSDEQDDRVLASRLSTVPEFRRTMGHQVLSVDQRISVRSVTLLFTDLSGSTAMYEELGDAEAYAVVRDHFRILKRGVEAWRGVQVKTIGDAIMAAFHTPDAALRSAIALIREFAVWRDSLGLEHPPGLRIGIHQGPALAVHSEASGLDYFGRTVNIAARAEGQARPGEIVVTEALHDLQVVQAVLTEEGLTTEPVQAVLKGIKGEVQLYRTGVTS